MTPNLGDKARDVITGFGGIVTGRCEYLTGCVQLLLSPTVDKDGKRQEGEWFDIDRIEVKKAGAVNLKVAIAGPDQPAPGY